MKSALAKSTTLWLIIIIAISGCRKTVKQQTLIPQDIKETVQQQVESGDNTGIVVGVITPTGREYYSYGSMKMGSEKPVDQDTLFEIGSISKVFTALLLADMVEQGEVALNDPIQIYLPEGVTAPVYKDTPIILEHLATHTSGLPSMPYNFNPENFNNPYTDFSPADLYDFFSESRLYQPPGNRYNYSNLGMGTLGHFMELYSKKDYETLLKERITNELGMPDTVITLSTEQLARLATGHYNRRPVGNWDFDVLAGAGAIRSTARDMLTFLGANMGLQSSRLLPAMQATHQPRLEADSASVQIGLGWHIRTADGEQIIWHEGGTGGYYSFAGFNPDQDIGVVVLTNTRRTLDEIGFRLLESGSDTATE